MYTDLGTGDQPIDPKHILSCRSWTEFQPPLRMTTPLTPIPCQKGTAGVLGISLQTMLKSPATCPTVEQL